MATHKLAILVSAVGAGKAAKDLRGVDAAVSSIGSKAGQGVRNVGRNLVGLGAIAAGGIALAVKSGIEDLATLESAVTSVDGSIKQMGLTGKVSGTQIAGWANEIEASVQAAFDDKDITKATGTLIRYGKVTQSNLRPAMVVMTDLAAKTGSVESASTLLAKALADPTKAAGKLARQGIVLTKQQQKQIAALDKVGDRAGAQKVILDALARTTGGAAANSVGEYGDALNMLSDASEDAKKALATGFLPVIKKVAELLSREMAKPETINNLRKFGEGLAKGLDSLIEIARNLPWETIGSSMKIAGAGGKAILEAFASMPPWVQTAVLTGWGLNKLSGGMLGGIVGELGKGLIKGVLGMNAAVVNINAGTVNGPGGPLGGPGGVKVPPVAGVVTPAIGAAMALDLERFHNKVVPLIDAMEAERKRLTGSLTGHGGPGRGNPANGSPMKGWAEASKGTERKITDLRHGAVEAIGKGTEAAKQNKTATDATKQTVAQQGMANRSAVVTGTSGTTSAVNTSANRIVNGFAANRAIINVSIKNSVSPSAINSSVTTSERYGSNTGSAGSGKNGSNDDRHNP